MSNVTDGAKGVKLSKEEYAKMMHKVLIMEVLKQTTPKKNKNISINKIENTSIAKNEPPIGIQDLLNQYMKDKSEASKTKSLIQAIIRKNKGKIEYKEGKSNSIIITMNNLKNKYNILKIKSINGFDSIKAITLMNDFRLSKNSATHKIGDSFVSIKEAATAHQLIKAEDNKKPSVSVIYRKEIKKVVNGKSTIEYEYSFSENKTNIQKALELETYQEMLIVGYSYYGTEDPINEDIDTGGKPIYYSLGKEKIGYYEKLTAEIKRIGHGKLIAIDPGHGMDTPGKRTPTFPDGTIMKEREFNKAVAQYIIPLLEAQEFSVINVAESDYSEPGKEDINGISNTTRVKLANNIVINKFNKIADFYLSIHANASGDGKSFNDGQGIETLIYIQDKGNKVEDVAKIIQKNMVGNGYNLKDRGIKYYDYEVLRETKMLAVIIECGFMTNLNEAELLRTEVYRKACAISLAKAMCEIISYL